MWSVPPRLVQALVLSAISWTTSCSLERPLTVDLASQLKGRRLARTERLTPPFDSGKPKVHLGLIGALVDSSIEAESDAAKAFEESSLLDPAQTISRQLSRDVEHRYGLGHASRPVQFDSDDVTQIAVLDSSADLVLDIWTNSWNLEPLREDLSKRYLQYSANLRLIDARAVHGIDGKRGLVIAEGTCESSPAVPSSAATRNQMLADGARRLRDEVEQAQQVCIHDFRTQLLQPH